MYVCICMYNYICECNSVNFYIYIFIYCLLFPVNTSFTPKTVYGIASANISDFNTSEVKASIFKIAF